jgi:hypothetical protein
VSERWDVRSAGLRAASVRVDVEHTMSNPRGNLSSISRTLKRFARYKPRCLQMPTTGTLQQKTSGVTVAAMKVLFARFEYGTRPTTSAMQQVRQLSRD